MTCRVIARLRRVARARPRAAAPAVDGNAASRTAAARQSIPPVLLGAFIVLATSLAGCGQKGPLVLPDRAQGTGQAGAGDGDGEDERRQDERRGETEERGDDR